MQYKITFLPNGEQEGTPIERSEFLTKHGKEWFEAEYPPLPAYGFPEERIYEDWEVETLSTSFCKILHYKWNEKKEEKPKIKFGNSTITIIKGRIWFDQYNWGMDGRKLKEVYDEYIRINNNPFGENKEEKDLISKIEEARDLLINLQTHIPQACIPGHEGFIDCYVDQALDILNNIINTQPKQ